MAGLVFKHRGPAHLAGSILTRLTKSGSSKVYKKLSGTLETSLGSQMDFSPTLLQTKFNNFTNTLFSFNILVSKWQSSNEECNTVENLPLFKKYCFAVNLQGALDEPLEVDYFYES